MAGTLDRHPELRLLVVDCAELESIDSLGALALARVLQDWTVEHRRYAELHGLSPALRRQLRRHPLAEFCPSGPDAEEEELFQDPFSGEGGWRPSRH